MGYQRPEPFFDGGCATGDTDDIGLDPARPPREKPAKPIKYDVTITVRGRDGSMKVRYLKVDRATIFAKGHPAVIRQAVETYEHFISDRETEPTAPPARNPEKR